MTDEHPFSLLPDYSVDALPAAQAVQVRRHLESCARCRVRLEALRATATLLRSLPEPPLPRSFVMAERPVAGQVRRSWTMPISFLSAAAVLFLALALSLTPVGRPSPGFTAASRAVASVVSTAAVASASVERTGPAAAAAPKAAVSSEVVTSTAAAASTAARPLAAARPAPQASPAASATAEAAGAAAQAPAPARPSAPPATAVPAASLVPKPTAEPVRGAGEGPPSDRQPIQVALAVGAFLCLVAAILTALGAAGRRSATGRG